MVLTCNNEHSTSTYALFHNCTVRPHCRLTTDSSDVYFTESKMLLPALFLTVHIRSLDLTCSVLMSITQNAFSKTKKKEKKNIYEMYLVIKIYPEHDLYMITCN